EEDRSSSLRDALHFADALLLKLEVAHGEDFVHEEHIGFEVSGHGEGQPHIHAAGVMLGRGVEKSLHSCERDDLAEASSDLCLGHSEDRPTQIDVLATGELGMKAGANLQQAADSAPYLGVSGRG